MKALSVERSLCEGDREVKELFEFPGDRDACANFCIPMDIVWCKNTQQCHIGIPVLNERFKGHRKMANGRHKARRLFAVALNAVGEVHSWIGYFSRCSTRFAGTFDQIIVTNITRRI